MDRIAHELKPGDRSDDGAYLVDLAWVLQHMIELEPGVYDLHGMSVIEYYNDLKDILLSAHLGPKKNG